MGNSSNRIYKSIKCEYCGLTFQDINNEVLDNHIQECITNKIPCEICNDYILFGEYKNHLLYAHSHEIDTGIKNCINKLNNIDNKNDIFEPNLSRITNSINFIDNTTLLNDILYELSLKLNYNNTLDMLTNYDLSCPICFEPTTNKLKNCIHPLCELCLNKNEICPICSAKI